MPNILIDNTKNKKPDATYAVKTCPSCGSVIEVMESEMKATTVTPKGIAHFTCPCGRELDIRVYWGGTMYDEKDYLLCTDLFHDKVTSMVWDDLREAVHGYGTMDLRLRRTKMEVTPISVTVRAYVDHYEHGNPRNVTEPNKIWRTYRFNMLALSKDMDECARYAQALAGYIRSMMKNVCDQRPGDTDLKLQSIDTRSLDAYFRNGDTGIDQDDIDEALRECRDEEKRIATNEAIRARIDADVQARMHA